ncbi:MAG TPA: alpha/beta hydrolase-fold protein [Candidatus Acidoferrales bacterium]|nr:alpha/beta hydrolase-fold protein [Candidatus Acidoferrales bacterium]
MQKNRSRRLRLAIRWGAAFALFVSAGGFLRSQSTLPSQHGTVERVKVHGASLEGNLEGDSPDRDVSVYLPPGYKTHSKQRYPVIYLLHGYTDNDDNWFGAKHIFVDAPAAIDRALTSGSREMIVVMPNAYTLYQGSMYSSSATVGDWEGFIVHDLVSYMDSHYRTIPGRASRGLAGHSMGGYGTMRLGMKYPEAFSSLYALSACCLAPNSSLQGPESAQVRAIHNVADLTKADFGTRAIFASAAAWSPNPRTPPFFVDIPWVDGKLQPMVVAKWDANTPLAMLDQYVPNLKKFRAIALDVGTKDGLTASIQQLDQCMTILGIPHTFETYDGNHISGIQERLEKKVMPFFSKNLSFGPAKR